MSRAALVFCLSLLALVSGCAPSLATVSGEVTVDGKPLARGVISYSPADGVGESMTANIENGKYTLQVTPGKCIVQISAPVVVGTRKEYNSPDAPSVEVTEESLPDRYHRATELTFDAQAGVNSKNWSLESK